MQQFAGVFGGLYLVTEVQMAIPRYFPKRDVSKENLYVEAIVAKADTLSVVSLAEYNNFLDALELAQMVMPTLGSRRAGHSDIRTLQRIEALLDSYLAGLGTGGGGVGVLATIAVKITGTIPLADDPMDINTGAFDTAGAQTVLETGGTLLLPNTEAEFLDNAFIKIFRNGVYQFKGASVSPDALVYYVNTTQLAFSFKLKKNDVITVETPETY